MNFKPTDSNILGGCINNDRRSQELLYKAFYPEMLEFVGSFCIPDDKVEDALNQGFLEIFQTIHTYDTSTSFTEWMYHAMESSIMVKWKETYQVT